MAKKKVSELTSVSATPAQDDILIINDVSKFKNAVTNGDKTLGFMYFLVGLSHVSADCWNTYYHLLLL